MSYPQIRLNKTNDIQNVLNYLKHHYSLLSEADIIKIALSKIYIDLKQNENPISLEQFSKNESKIIESLPCVRSIL